MRPSRIGQNVWSSTIAAVLLGTTLFITLPAQALDIPGFLALPPDPGIAGEATIDGIDVNKNGVRDEIEVVLFQNYWTNPSVREILYHMAIYYQAMLRQSTNATVVLNNFGYLTAYSHCLESLTGSATQDGNMLRAEVLNTYNRSKAYITAMNTIANVVSIPLKTVSCTALPVYPYVPPGTPSSITIPIASASFTYTISWSAAVGTVTRYELQRDTALFFTASPVTTTYSGSVLSTSVTAPQDGLYFYRVRACNDIGCGNYRSSSTNGVLVSGPTGGGDVIAPTVAITAPASNSVILLGSTTTISATASDNVAVAGVQFTLNGATLGVEDTTAPYSMSWNTTGLASGSHVLSAIARDASGNPAMASPVTVTVTTCPTCNLPSGKVGTAYPVNTLRSGMWVSRAVLKTGNYPPGLSAYRADYDGNSYRSLLFGGTPTTAGIYNFGLEVWLSPIGGGGITYWYPTYQIEIKP